MEQITDHAARAIARLLTQYRGAARLEAVVAAFADQVQAVEDAFADLLLARSLEAAAGAQLDVLGAILGEARQGYGDEAYRTHIAARVQTNRSGGTIPEVIAVMDSLALTVVDASATTVLIEQPPAAFVVRIGVATATGSMVDFLLSFLRALKPGGVRGILEWFHDPPADTFTWDGTADQAWDVGTMSSAKT